MVGNPVIDIKIKHFPSVYDCGDEHVCGAWDSVQLLKNQILPH